ncbi:lytic murein transglycosylase [bacterium]|nr:lytic murein transglycosylase [bacterium]
MKRKSAIILTSVLLTLVVFIYLNVKENLKIIPARAEEAVENFSDSESSTEKEKNEKKIDETEEEIEEVEEEKEEVMEEKKELEQDLGQIQNFIYYTQKEINKTESLIGETEETISRKESELDFLNKKNAIQKKLLGQLIRETYYSKREPSIGIFLGERKFSQMLGNIDYLNNLQERIIFLIGNVKKSKEKISGEKEELKKIKSDHQQLLNVKSDQQEALAGDKIQTQSKINEKAATIQQLQSKISKLKSSLSKLLGKNYDAKDIKDAARFASKATGVRKDFIMGMLVVESDLGRYTGGCTYKASRMSSYRKKIFKDICEDLDYNYKKMKVSCPPSKYSGTGGAMGVAQFMPDTWAGYESSIVSVTGHNPPDPWNLTDGVTAMALKLAKVPGVTKHKKSAEKNAAKLYLSGTTSSKYDWYGERVLYWAENYKKLLD